MSEIALAKINSFASSVMQADFVPPSEQLITLTYGQLQDLITRAIEKAVQPLQDEVSQLQATVAGQGAEIAALRTRLAAVESLEEQDVTRLACDISQDRRRLAALESRTTGSPAPAGDKTAARIAKLKEFLKARGGGATFHEIEKLLGIRPNQMTKLVAQLDMRSFEVFTRTGDGRQRVLRLKCFT